MWKPLSDYCWTNGSYNICKIGSANGYNYEAWTVSGEQLAVNLPTSKAAMEVCGRHAPQKVSVTTTGE